MIVNNLHQLITLLDTDGELRRITAVVDPVMEIAAITNRISKLPGGGAALLFTQPAGSNVAVATNLFGSTKRVCRALGITTLNTLTTNLAALLDEIPDFDITSIDRQLTSLPAFNQFAAQIDLQPDTDMTCMAEPDLTRLPFLHSWPDDGATAGHGRYITLPQVFSVDPTGGTANCGMYRVQLRGKCEAAIQWKSGSGAARHAELYRQAGTKMPVAIVLGGPPATLFSAMFPLPGNLDELTFAGFLRGAPLTTVACATVPLQVPKGAEIVIEGYVEPGELVTEGPFGNHSGYYAPAAPAALMRVTSISHRKDAIIPATVVGPPPMEDCWMAQAWERLLLAILRKIAPVITNIHYPFEWMFHQSAIISLEKPHPDMVRKLAGQLWDLPWFKSARILLFISTGAEQPELHHAAWRTINIADFTTGIIRDRTSERIAIDATGGTISRQEVKESAAITDLVARRWKEYQLP